MNIIVWILFGALAGWIASLIMSTNEEQGMLKNIIIGIGGALVGGFLAQIFGIGSVDGFDGTSLLIAIMGSIIIISLMRLGRSHA